MKKIIFILGGARSGKSSYAVNLAKSFGKRIVFIATCIPKDKEMRERIKSHKKFRPRTWKVIEESINLDSRLKKLKKGYDAILIDCLGLFISNLMEVENNDKIIEKKVEKIIKQIKRSPLNSIVVSNEVGEGIVPDNPFARRFCNLLGKTNQIFAQQADKVIMMVAGIPVIIKGEKDGVNK
ncbi:MAG: bifunctional adenosylcobinamide kinase/adenosylcobinamide-phosphate guanylyltransferase [Candidatus Omnitrophica bacterium]|nr:bifunctional adenosylcobinamide kinase/adenosylcobinamide-phosphate guanylyltransferase [Candidatus Omnitrophota bacterium]